jgi:EAL domain-containing protein (putative c-di-GMP-specific phosphodiesterase class I)
MKFTSGRRSSFLYLRAPAAAAAVSLGWAIGFGYAGQPDISFIIAALSAALVGCWLVTLRHGLSSGMPLAQITCLFFTTYFCLFHDVPSEAVPRVTHLYFLAIASVGITEYRRTSARFQPVLIGTSLFGFLLFSSLPLSFSFARPLPDSLRHVTALINSASALTVLAASLFLHARASREIDLVQDIRRALGAGQIELFYQPVIGRSGRTEGAEALLRWRHPVRGILSPHEFLPAAQQAGLMEQIGQSVLREADGALSRWASDPRTRHLILSVNISADQFAHPDFVESLNVFRRDSAPARNLRLELTESALVADLPGLTEKMRALQALGVLVSLDDFGTGYSSLSYLRELPLQQLKIDKSFVQATSVDPRTKALTRNIVKLAMDLDLETVAEGIETKDQFEFMKSCGCDLFQGYLFSRALPLEEFESFVFQEQRAAAP